MKDHHDEQRIIELLADRWPNCFAVRECQRRPLKVGIRADLEFILADAVPLKMLHAAIRFYVNNDEYLRRLLPGAWRFDLDGKPAGSVTADEVAAARTQLESRVAKKARQKEAAVAAAAVAARKAEAERPQKLRAGIDALREAGRRRREMGTRVEA
jgi:ProP effector